MLLTSANRDKDTGTLGGFDSVFRDVLIGRMLFERPQLPHGGVRETARDNTGTTSPNTTGRALVLISVQRVNADFMRMQTHTHQDLREDCRELVAYPDMLRLLIPFLKIESQ